jgi:micrococcal nuclease
MKCKILRNSIIILTVFLVFSLIVEVYITRDNSMGYTSEGENTQSSRKNVEKVVVVGHVSGSVIKVEMQNGLECNVQLAGAFTPFSGKDYDASYEYSLEKLPEGKTIFLEKALNFAEFMGSEYKIRYVWMNEPSKDPEIDEIKNNLYDARIVLDGFGYSIPSWYDSYYNNYIQEFGKYASKNKLGLWE